MHNKNGFVRHCPALKIWLIFFGLLISGLAQNPVIAWCLLGFYKGAGRMLTYYMARKGWILEKKTIHGAGRLAQIRA